MLDSDLHQGSTIQCEVCGWVPVEDGTVPAQVKAHVDSGHRSFTQATLPLGLGFDALRAEEQREQAVEGYRSMMSQVVEGWAPTPIELVREELEHAMAMIRAYALFVQTDRIEQLLTVAERIEAEVATDTWRAMAMRLRAVEGELDRQISEAEEAGSTLPEPIDPSEGELRLVSAFTTDDEVSA